MARLEFQVVQAIQVGDVAARDISHGFGYATLTPTLDGWNARTNFSIAGKSDTILAAKVHGEITIGTAPLADAIETTQAWLIDGLPDGVEFSCNESRESDYVQLLFTLKPAHPGQA